MLLGVGVLYTAIGWPLSNSAQSDFLMYVLFSQWCLYKNCFCHTWVVCLILRCQLRVAGDEAQWTKGRRRKRGEAMSLTYLHVSWESYTHKKSNIWGKKIYVQFFYLPSILHMQINQMSLSWKLSQPKFLAKQRQWEDDQVSEQQKKKGEVKKESGRERSI